jgi:hypothetical protein
MVHFGSIGVFTSKIRQYHGLQQCLPDSCHIEPWGSVRFGRVIMSTQNFVVANVVDSGKVRLSGDAINPIRLAVTDKGKVKTGGASLSLTKPAKDRR